MKGAAGDDGVATTTSLREPTPEPMDAIDRAEKAVDDLCTGRLRWEMRVPAEPDHDPDLIIAAALQVARKALSRVKELESALWEAHDRMESAFGSKDPEEIATILLFGQESAYNFLTFRAARGE